MIDEPFSGGDTALHRVDPRAKIIGAAALTLVSALVQSFTPALAALAVGSLLAVASRPSPAKLAKRLLAVNGFILFLWLVLPLTMPGEAAARLGPIAVSAEGVRTAALITVKCNAIVLTLVALIATSTVPDLGHALMRLGVPAKLCFLLLFSYRHLDVIASEYSRLSRAARARCFTPGTNLHTYRSVANLMGMVLVRSLDRSRRVYQAMLLRGFDGRFHSLSTQRGGLGGIVLAAGLLIIAAGLAWIESVY
jgi:cobalt/nickel transport system permease protein